MYVLFFIYTALYYGQPLDSMTMENLDYAVFANQSDCIHNLPELSHQFKHKLLTEYQSVPYFFASCEPAAVTEYHLDTTHYQVIERKISDEALGDRR